VQESYISVLARVLDHSVPEIFLVFQIEHNMSSSTIVEVCGGERLHFVSGIISSSVFRQESKFLPELYKTNGTMSESSDVMRSALRTYRRHANSSTTFDI
jgi:hypothetical protein